MSNNEDWVLGKQHAQVRAGQRMGVATARGDLANLTYRVQRKPNDQAWYVGPGSGTSERWVARYQGRWWYFAVDAGSRKVCTVFREPCEDRLVEWLGPLYEVIKTKIEGGGL